jgi:hypothetical protein
MCNYHYLFKHRNIILCIESIYIWINNTAMYQVVWLRNMPLLSVHCVRFVTYLPNCIRLSNQSLSTCPLYAVTQQLFIYPSFVSSYTAIFYLLALCIRSPKDCTYLSIVDPFTVFPYPTVFDVQPVISIYPL